jgi:uncharacterized membrane protein HdeD (DUF308 family)
MRILGAARRFLARHQRSFAIIAGTLLVIAGVGMVFLPAALVLAGVAVIGFFGIDFGRAAR